MHCTFQFVQFFIASFGMSLALWPMLRRPGWSRKLWWLVPAFLAFTPYFIAAEFVVLRAFACVLAVELFFKTIDFALRFRKSALGELQFISYARFLIPFPVFLVRYGEDNRERRFSGSGLALAVAAAAVFATCFGAVAWFASFESVRASFMLDHTLKFVVFTIAIESLARMLLGLEHFVGFKTKPLIDNAWASLTVGDFWSRYNTRVHDWFLHNVYRSNWGKKSPVRATMVTFLASAVLHEIGFAIATSTLNGYQFLFFLLQAPAVWLGNQLKRRTASRPGRVLLRCSTIIWMWATSILFFHGVDRVFPFFYASESLLP